MAVSSNSNAGSTETKVGAGALSNFNVPKTENKSNGNFSGGDINFDTSKLSINNHLNTNEPQQPTFDVDSVFKPTLSGNLDIDLPKSNNNNNSNTTYSNNSSKPTMTVDEVYGKSSNQPVVEKQGDYSASSNEKSKVETSTFGKQNEISVTPTSVTENKGMVGNATIQSVEGLDFQQKDKASVDVLDSKKKRDEVEAEDKADSMRNKLKAVAEKDAGETEDNNAFQVGEKNTFEEQNKAKLDQLNNKKQELDAANAKVEKKLNFINENVGRWNNLKEDAKAQKQSAEETKKATEDLIDTIADLTANPAKALFNRSEINELKSNMIKDAKNYGLDLDPKDNVQDIARQYTDAVKAKCDKDIESADSFIANADTAIELSNKEYEEAKVAQQEAQANYNKANQEYNTWKTKYWTNAEKTKAVDTTEPEPNTPQSGAETSYNDAVNAIKNSADATPEQKAQAEEALTNLEDSRKELEEKAAKARSGNPADMVAYQEALETYNKNLKEAQKIGNRWTQTDFNEKYTRAVAQANDFKVTLADGTEMEYSDFATEEATKSPQYAKAMYEKKANDYETDGHPILAKIERWKAEMSQTWLGSKLTFADNKVRDQFNQMAKADMRATYAAYNNVLNDKTGKYSDDDKAKASTAINQAKALMTASAALQASTGFLSSFGDSVDDGTFGTTDPKARNAWQKILNTVDNIIKITLGLGISPAANKAYQNMYYMAGDKVNNSLLFNKDFDGDGFALCQEYGNNAATGMIAGASELAIGVVMVFNPSSIANGLNLIVDSISTFTNGLYGVRNEAEKSQQYTQEVLEYFKEAEDIAESSGNEEAVQEITNAITQIENFELKADEVGNLDNWLEGSGSNTATNEKFNQSLSYDEWLKLIEADPVMKEYAKSLAEKKKKDENAQKGNADAGVNS